MTRRIFCGTFESEAYWRPSSLATLPSITDSGASWVVDAMDEMLFAFCGDGDAVLTTRRMSQAHVDHLRAAGFSFSFNRFDLFCEADKSQVRSDGRSPSVFDLLNRATREDVASYLRQGGALDPFAVLPGAEEAVRRYSLEGAFPSQEVIRSVNTKSYALHVRDLTGIMNVGHVVDDVQQLLDVGSKLLERGPFLIKDDYGVSGKGNQLIKSQAVLERVGKHLSKQCIQGKQVKLVLEPNLLKLADFSSQFRVERDGVVTMLSVQELVNNGHAFGASCSASKALLEALDRSEYFDLMRRVGSQLFRDGYFGDVCVDSMLLEGGELAPLVEINARKSMSLLKHAIDQRVGSPDRVTCLTQVKASNHGGTGVEALLERLRRTRLLFEVGYESGIILLTSGTMFPAPSINTAGVTTGRLYLAVTSDGAEQRSRLLEEFSRVLEEVDVRVLH